MGRYINKNGLESKPGEKSGWSGSFWRSVAVAFVSGF